MQQSEGDIKSKNNHIIAIVGGYYMVVPTCSPMRQVKLINSFFSVLYCSPPSPLSTHFFSFTSFQLIANPDMDHLAQN